MQEFSISVGQNGRVVIPASVRQQIGIEQGQNLLLTVDGDKIILEKTTGILNKLRERFQAIPDSLSEELIEERKIQAVRENDDS